jgi:hypothetical protein
VGNELGFAIERSSADLRSGRARDRPGTAISCGGSFGEVEWRMDAQHALKGRQKVREKQQREEPLSFLPFSLLLRISFAFHTRIHHDQKVELGSCVFAAHSGE